MGHCSLVVHEAGSEESDANDANEKEDCEKKLKDIDEKLRDDCDDTEESERDDCEDAEESEREDWEEPDEREEAEDNEEVERDDCDEPDERDDCDEATVHSGRFTPQQAVLAPPPVQGAPFVCPPYPEQSRRSIQ